MFQCKIDEIFNDMPNVFGIADDILVIGYDKDGADHDGAVYSVLRQCQDVNLKLNKDKCHFRQTTMKADAKQDDMGHGMHHTSNCLIKQNHY